MKYCRWEKPECQPHATNAIFDIGDIPYLSPPPGLPEPHGEVSESHRQNSQAEAGQGNAAGKVPICSKELGGILQSSPHIKPSEPDSYSIHQSMYNMLLDATCTASRSTDCCSAAELETCSVQRVVPPTALTCLAEHSGGPRVFHDSECS